MTFLRPRRLPFTRLGLLLVVGALAASVFRFYIAFAQEAADLSSNVPTDRKGLSDHFVHDFLFSGSAAGLLFWGGLLLMIVGIARNLMRR